ncbi:MAG: hypothetical protein JWN04_5080 [Myxococcaceae bacterium]|nr:hypothetical protein [Myxococcaceae bacterium]
MSAISKIRNNVVAALSTAPAAKRDRHAANIEERKGELQKIVLRLQTLEAEREAALDDSAAYQAKSSEIQAAEFEAARLSELQKRDEQRLEFAKKEVAREELAELLKLAAMQLSHLKTCGAAFGSALKSLHDARDAITLAALQFSETRAAAQELTVRTGEPLPAAIARVNPTAVAVSQIYARGKELRIGKLENDQSRSIRTWLNMPENEAAHLAVVLEAYGLPAAPLTMTAQWPVADQIKLAQSTGEYTAKYNELAAVQSVVGQAVAAEASQWTVEPQLKQWTVDGEVSQWIVDGEISPSEQKRIDATLALLSGVAGE